MKRIINLFVIIWLFMCYINGQDPGFFLDDWEAKNIDITEYNILVKPSSQPSAIINIDYADVITPISKYLFGNNANTYMTQMVDQPDLLNHITNLSPNVVRFPGGNLSNLFFWDMEPDAYYSDLPSELIDGIDGSVDPASYWSGKNTAGWTITLDNYYQMLNMTGQTGMITVNYSYARYGLSSDPVAQAAEYAANWVRYDNGKTKFWEIGNENAGPWQAGWQINTATNQDGQPEIINGGIYGEHFLVFANAMRAAAAEIGHEIFIGAQLIQYDAENTWNPPDKDWNELYFAAAGNAADFYIVHTYYTPYNENSTVETMLNSARSETESIMNWMRTTTSRAGAELKPIALTEWNTSAVGSMQAVSHINGMHAAMAVGELILNKYGEASRWDFANGWSNGDDHGMFNKGDEPGGVPLWNPRPDFYHLYYMQKYFGDRAIKSVTAGNANIQSYASKFSSGQTAVTVANKGRTDEVVQLTFENFAPGTRYYWYTLEGGTDNGDFSRQVFINGEGPESIAGGPSNYQNITARSALSDGGVKLTVPALSVTHMIIDKGSGSSNQYPVAAVSASVASGPIALTVDFSAEGSYDPDNDNLTYMWDFGDGYNATGLTTSHIYSTAGDYTATLTVFDGSNIDQATIDISATAEGATCESPTVALLPLEQDGGGEHCWEVTGTIYNVNSWGMWAVYINGEDFTNKYSETIPAKINGKYYIYVNAGESWSHVTIDGINESGTVYYNLATNVDGQGSVSLSPSDGTYEENTIVSLTAIPQSGWEFTSWQGDVTGTVNPEQLKMDSDKSVTATFSESTQQTYTINVLVSGSGSVSMNPAGGTYTEGAEVVLTAIPASGYQFDQWSGYLSGSTNPQTVIVSSDLDITANFSVIPVDYYTLSTSTDGNGAIELTPSGGSYPSGSIVQAEAIPDADYIFGSWSGDISGTVNPVNITMDKNTAIIAQFEEFTGIPCESPVSVSVPFTQNSVGIYCYSTTDDITYVNSWNMNVVEINGVDYTNIWSGSMPAKINGAYVIYYDGGYAWSHLEVAGTKLVGKIPDGRPENILVYPNPFIGSTSIYIKDPDIVSHIQITDCSGRLIKTVDKPEINTEIPIGSDLKPGLYILSVRMFDNVKVFIINKY